MDSITMGAYPVCKTTDIVVCGSILLEFLSGGDFYNCHWEGVAEQTGVTTPTRVLDIKRIFWPGTVQYSLKPPYFCLQSEYSYCIKSRTISME